jgi:uncharacterized protein
VIWHNEPPEWTATGAAIRATTAPRTDFWRTTHYGFVRDNGHFYSREWSGDFVAEDKVSGTYRALYDQAGLMVRTDETTWLKCGIDYLDGVQHASAVVRRDFSDWSVSPLPTNPLALWLRLTRTGPAVEVRYSLGGMAFELLRLASLTPAPTVQVGVMCASPEGDGFAVTFEEFAIRR